MEAAKSTKKVMTPTTQREDTVTAAAGTRLRFRSAADECTASTKDWPVKATIGRTKLHQNSTSPGDPWQKEQHDKTPVVQRHKRRAYASKQS